MSLQTGGKCPSPPSPMTPAFNNPPSAVHGQLAACLRASHQAHQPSTYSIGGWPVFYGTQKWCQRYNPAGGAPPRSEIHQEPATIAAIPAVTYAPAPQAVCGPYSAPSLLTQRPDDQAVPRSQRTPIFIINDPPRSVEAITNTCVDRRRTLVDPLLFFASPTLDPSPANPSNRKGNGDSTKIVSSTRPSNNVSLPCNCIHPHKSPSPILAHTKAHIQHTPVLVINDPLRSVEAIADTHVDCCHTSVDPLLLFASPTPDPSPANPSNREGDSDSAKIVPSVRPSNVSPPYNRIHTHKSPPPPHDHIHLHKSPSPILAHTKAHIQHTPVLVINDPSHSIKAITDTHADCCRMSVDPLLLFLDPSPANPSNHEGDGDSAKIVSSVRPGDNVSLPYDHIHLHKSPSPILAHTKTHISIDVKHTSLKTTSSIHPYAVPIKSKIIECLLGRTHGNFPLPLYLDCHSLSYFDRPLLMTPLG